MFFIHERKKGVALFEKDINGELLLFGERGEARMPTAKFWRFTGASNSLAVR